MIFIISHEAELFYRNSAYFPFANMFGNLSKNTFLIYKVSE